MIWPVISEIFFSNLHLGLTSDSRISVLGSADDKFFTVSLDTLLVILVLLVYGGEVIRPFSFTMLVGVIIGTYSSIYIASALLATIYQNSK